MRWAWVFIAALAVSGCNYRESKLPSQPAPQSENTGKTVTYEMVRAQVLEPLCLECHNTELAKAGLDLSSRQAAQAAIRAGDPGESLLYNMVDWDEMPPKRRIPPLRLLTPEEKTMVRDWIMTGAK